MNHSYWLITFSLLLSSCIATSDIIDSNCGNGNNTYDLELISQRAIQLDSTTRFPSYGLYYYKEDNHEYLVYENIESKRIDVYDLISDRLVKKIKLEKEGPNGIDYRPHAFYFHNLDSIFLFHNMPSSLTLINSKGEIVDQEQRHIPLIVDVGNTSLAKPFIDGEMIPFTKDGKLYMGSKELGYRKGRAGVVLDLSSKKITNPISVNQLYQNGWWVGLAPESYFHAYNKQEKLIVQSFGGDHNVYVIDSDDRVFSYCAESRFINKIEPYSSEVGNYMEEENEIFKFQALQGAYSTIRYDPWQKVYYRIVLKPIDEDQYHTPYQIWSDISIIILNSSFEKIGETDLGTDYYISMFISPSGLHIFNKKEYDKNEDVAVFDVFKIKKL